MNRHLLGWLAAGIWGLSVASEYPLPEPEDGVIGELREVPVLEGDTLGHVARRENIGHEEIRAANPGMDFWLPDVGAAVLIPDRHILPAAEREGVVVNLPEMRLYHFLGNGRVVTSPISIGRMDWQTPLGETRVTGKVRNPSWTPPESVHAEARADGRVLPRVVPPGPDNPLGDYAIRLALPGYLIHGTNRPYGVGMRVTHGCIRMYPEDIEQLFPRVDVGTPVTIVNQPVKVGWSGDQLYLEVHEPLEEEHRGEDWLRSLANERAAWAAGERGVGLSWARVRQVVEERKGIPVRVSAPEFP